MARREDDNVGIIAVEDTANIKTLVLGGDPAKAVAGTTLAASGAELNFNDGAIAGTAVASKTLVLGATKNVDTLVIADGGLKLGAGAGTAVTATAAELNLIDGTLAGTAVASKAVALDASKDIAGIRYLTLGSNGVGGAAGQVILDDGANPGYQAIVKTDAQTANLTVHVPDPGAIVDAYVALSTAALTNTEVDQLDGATAANSVASKCAVLDGNKRLQTNSANGTLGSGVTAVHYGDGINVTAELTLTNTPLTVGSSESLGVGVKIFTLPAGAALIRDAYMSVGLSGVTTTTDTPDVGIGTVIASGVVTTLDGTATFENIITGQTASDTNGTATVKATGPTAGAPLEITAAGSHDIFLNMADGWGANADAVGVLNGKIVISYIWL